MTQPREIQPGLYYLITRRCVQRQFFLRPGKVTNAVFEFVLAESASLFSIEILEASFLDRPKSHEPRRNLRPYVACKTPKLRVAALLALKAFRCAYSKARELFAEGVRDVVFPAGTWDLRRLGVRCCEAPRCAV